jgi:hypothetical protein
MRRAPRATPSASSPAGRPGARPSRRRPRRGADAGHQRAGGRQPADAAEEPLVLELHARVAAREDEHVQAVDVGPRDVRQHLQPVGTADSVTRLGDRAHRHASVTHGAPRGQHLVRPGEVELLDPVPDGNGDPGLTHDPPLDPGQASGSRERSAASRKRRLVVRLSVTARTVPAGAAGLETIFASFRPCTRWRR